MAWHTANPLEVIVVNAGPDIHGGLENGLAQLATDGWTNYSRPERGSHPGLQIRKGEGFQIVVLDLGPGIAAWSPVELMRPTVIPGWFMRDIVTRIGQDVLILLLAPVGTLQAISYACARSNVVRRKMVPLPREPEHWTSQGVTFGGELERLWAELHSGHIGWLPRIERWFGTPGDHTERGQ